ncbi:hypothetical protein CcCBS67573_g10085 [Chytriomyces confervae]|uniref:Carboxypeptidase M14A n=1 Tax=Chytriomyces confervae TaxID=246404 RepID=A0A507DGX4_9FUNG|nr:hypothetical protein CcCBS67573_g10085 [Chytriomyces confervae]
MLVRLTRNAATALALVAQTLFVCACLSMLGVGLMRGSALDGLQVALFEKEVEGARVRFDGHQVWRVPIASQKDLDAILALRRQVPAIDFWTEPRIAKNGVDIRVSANRDVKATLAAYLQSAGLAHSVFIADLQVAIDEQISTPSRLESAESDAQTQLALADPFKTYFTKYHTIAEINEFLIHLNKTHDSMTELFSLGETYEGRTQWGLHIHSPRSSVASKRDKKELFFFGGHHAREWIGPAVVQFIMSELLTKYGKDSAITAALDEFDFTIVPVVNVDGYEFTHTSNRMWRKNRQPNKGNACIGTDPNRNWDTNWGGDGSTSKNPCSDSFVGSGPFSAPEPRNIAEYLKSRKGNIVSFIDFHAYSQLWMYPFGSYCDVFADIVVEKAAKDAAAALKAVHGKSFAVGSICNIIYQAAGSSVDWAYETANVTFSYGVELRDQGLYGFMLPPKQIIPSGEETLAAVLALVKYIRGYLKDQEI